MTIKWTNQTIRERTFKISKKLEINFKTDILKITKAGKGGIENESESLEFKRKTDRILPGIAR